MGKEGFAQKTAEEYAAQWGNEETEQRSKKWMCSQMNFKYVFC